MPNSVYIHIPFCNPICTYCDFCKIYPNKIDEYLLALEKEIKENYHNEIIKTLYIGGGTPSILNLRQLKKLFNILEIFNLENAEITFEANSNDLTEEKINFLKNHINRLSIGLQTNNPKYLKDLGRTSNLNNIKKAIKIIQNVNLDLMYGFQNQTLNDLKEDLDLIIKLNPKHISTYSLIIEPHTKLYINNYTPLDDDKEAIMYEYIVSKLKENNFNQYELSNFAKENYESKHNLVYWNNEHYYGFGLGASGYIKNIRYENTRSLNDYLKGKYRLEETNLNEDEIIQNEFILGLRKIKGISEQKFKEKYKIDIKSISQVNKLLNLKILLEENGHIFINSKYLYTSNEILLNFIDLSLHKH